MKRFATYLALVLTLFVVVACGGSGSGGSATNTFAGAYKRDFTRGAVPNTTMLVTIANNGSTTFVISDATGVLYSGTGTTTPTGHVTGTATGVAPTVGTVTIVGDLSGTPPSMAVTTTGALTDSISLVQVATGGVSALAGNMNGSYFGSETGTFTMAIASDGAVTGTVNVGATTIPIHGSVTVSGAVNFTGTGTVGTTQWTGSFFFVPGSPLVQGIGTWVNGSEHGTWSASQ
jgi:hypothetical protein